MVQMGQAKSADAGDSIPDRSRRWTSSCKWNACAMDSGRIIQISEVIGLEGDVIPTNDIACVRYKEEDVHGEYWAPIGPPTHCKFKSRLAYYG